MSSSKHSRNNSSNCPVKSRKELLNNEYKSDVRFLVGQDRTTFYGHKLLIEIHSPVFYKMFNSDFMERQEGEISIPDIEGQIFFNILRYMYTGEIFVSKETLVDLFYAADKYMIEDLKRIYLNVIDTRNVLKVLQHNSETHKFVELNEKCLETIVNNPIEVFAHSEELIQLNKANVELILSQNYFKANISDLLHFLKVWKDKNEGNSTKEIESKLRHQMLERRKLRKILFWGNMDSDLVYGSDIICISMTAVEAINIIGMGILWSADTYELFNIFVDDEFFDQGFFPIEEIEDGVLKIFFSKVSLQKHQALRIEIIKKSPKAFYTIMRTTKICCDSLKLVTGGPGEEVKSVIQYLIQEKN